MPYEHILTIEADGNYHCSCGVWSSKLLGPIGGQFAPDRQLVERWHLSHKNALVIAPVALPIIWEPFITFHHGPIAPFTPSDAIPHPDAAAVVFSVEQAFMMQGQYYHANLPLMCIDIPRAKYCLTVADAVEFFNRTEAAPVYGKSKVEEVLPKLRSYVNATARDVPDDDLQEKWVKLAEYADHQVFCPALTGSTPCTCGFSDLVASLTPGKG